MKGGWSIRGLKVISYQSSGLWFILLLCCSICITCWQSKKYLPSWSMFFYSLYALPRRFTAVSSQAHSEEAFPHSIFRLYKTKISTWHNFQIKADDFRSRFSAKELVLYHLWCTKSSPKRTFLLHFLFFFNVSGGGRGISCPMQAPP